MDKRLDTRKRKRVTLKRVNRDNPALESQNDIWGKLVKANILDDVFTMLNQEDCCYDTVAGFCQDHGVSTTRFTISRLKMARNQDWLYQMAVKEAVEHRMEEYAGDEDDPTMRQVTKKMLSERMFTLATIGELSSRDVIAAQKQLLDEEVAEIKRQETKKRLYELQLKSASFIADFLRDEARTEELRQMAKQGLSAEDFLEKVRIRVYGSDAVAQPDDYHHVGERRVNGDVIDEDAIVDEEDG